MMRNITPIGVTDYRNQHQPFGIKDGDRMRHIYVLGKTGVGKSTLLQTMAISDIERGIGLAVIDPHGEIAENLLHYIPESRIDDVIYFNATDIENQIAFNPLFGIPEKKRHLVLSGLIATFKKIWADSWGPRLEYILRFTLSSLLNYPKATLLDIQPMLTDYNFRKKVLSYSTDLHIHAFWHNEFDKYPPQVKIEAISPILNKAGLFNALKPLRNIVGQIEPKFKMQEVLDSKKILICNLAKGGIGEDASSLLGSLLINAIQLAAVGRSGQPEEKINPFYLYIDEAHSFVTLSIIDILAEARKYKLSLFLTHQYLDQIDEKVRTAIFGNVGTLICFRVGPEDADYLESEFYPVFTKEDFMNLPKHRMYLRLMIDGTTSRPFSATTFAPQTFSKTNKKEVITFSRMRYGTRKEVVEKDILVRNRKLNEGSKELRLFV